jgi:tetratricopeptide (TPR) repeat protein
VANLDAEQASLKGEQTARLSAMKRVGELSPGDTELVRSLAESELRAGQFAEAASDWKKLADLLPNDAAVWNSLGYARSYAGSFASAMAAFQEYVRLAPGDPNPLDSIGDLDYAYRKFGDAAARYLEANEKNANFQQGGELYKAAWAKYSAGDKAAADQLFARFEAARAKSSDTLIPLIAADWLYRTGRAKEAATQLRQVVSDTKSAALRADGYSQLAIWDLLVGDRARAAMDAKPATGPANVVWAIMRFATLPSASAAEWKARAEQTIPSPAMIPLRRLALGYALLLDGKREAALPVWEEIARTAPGTDFFTRAIYARLQGKPLPRALLPDPNNVNQFAGILDRL